MNYEGKNPWKREDYKVKENVKLSIAADNYLEKQDEESLELFKEELSKSSKLVVSVVLHDIIELSKKENLAIYKELIELLLLKLEQEQNKNGVYDPMIGDIIYPDKDNKKINM